MFWIFASVALVLVGILYFASSNFQTGVNNLFAALGQVCAWIARRRHFPAWLGRFFTWLWHVIRFCLFCFFWIAAGFLVLTVFGLVRHNIGALILAYALFGGFLTVLIVIGDGIRNFVNSIFTLFRISTPFTSRATTKFLISMTMWVGLQLILMSWRDNFYLNHPIVPGVITLSLLMLLMYGWFTGKTGNAAATIMIVCYFLGVAGLVYTHWDVVLPRKYASKIKTWNAEHDRRSTVEEGNAKMSFARIKEPATGYAFNPADTSFSAANPRVTFKPGELVKVYDHGVEPVQPSAGGEVMIRVVVKNPDGEYLGGNIWVAFRKIEILSPEDIETRKQVADAAAHADSLKPFRVAGNFKPDPTAGMLIKVDNPGNRDINIVFSSGDPFRTAWMGSDKLSLKNPALWFELVPEDGKPVSGSYDTTSKTIKING